MQCLSWPLVAVETIYELDQFIIQDALVKDRVDYIMPVSLCAGDSQTSE